MTKTSQYIEKRSLHDELARLSANAATFFFINGREFFLTQWDVSVTIRRYIHFTVSHTTSLNVPIKPEKKHM